jgi:hypothetical protein
MTSDAGAKADQEAARRREAESQVVAWHESQPVTIRTIAVQADHAEAMALAAGEVLPGIQVQVDRQVAEDAAIDAIEHAFRERGR